MQWTQMPLVPPPSSYDQWMAFNTCWWGSTHPFNGGIVPIGMTSGAVYDPIPYEKGVAPRMWPADADVGRPARDYFNSQWLIPEPDADEPTSSAVEPDALTDPQTSTNNTSDNATSTASIAGPLPVHVNSEPAPAAPTPFRPPPAHVNSSPGPAASTSPRPPNANMNVPPAPTASILLSPLPAPIHAASAPAASPPLSPPLAQSKPPATAPPTANSTEACPAEPLPIPTVNMIPPTPTSSQDQETPAPTIEDGVNGAGETSSDAAGDGRPACTVPSHSPPLTESLREQTANVQQASPRTMAPPPPPWEALLSSSAPAPSPAALTSSHPALAPSMPSGPSSPPTLTPVTEQVQRRSPRLGGQQSPGAASNLPAPPAASRLRSRSPQPSSSKRGGEPLDNSKAAKKPRSRKVAE